VSLTLTAILANDITAHLPVKRNIMFGLLILIITALVADLLYEFSDWYAYRWGFMFF
jgi:hypothetical protein